ncbi:MAG: glycosyltransferase family 4 protein [Candidatus Chisholmbacteria bacterium]|nr:glycosyltransferase family 4 protein [Candidatus Chisholmbacteria bacterium]
MKPKVLFVYRTRRQPVLDNWLKGKEPDTKLFGLNHLQTLGYQVDFFDTAYSIFNPLHWLAYPLEHAILGQVGMGFKLDQALTLLPRLNHYDVIVGTGDSAGLPLVWLKSLGLLKKPLMHMSSALSGALRAQPRSWVVSFYRKVFRAVDLVTAYAEVEREYFIRTLKVPPKKVVFMPYGIDFRFWARRKKVKRSVVVAAGIDLTRDYGTFFKAIKDLDIKVEIACHPDNLKGLTVPKNVRVKFLIDYLTMRRMLQRALVVVVPLREAHRSAGQMVALEAAAAGAPLVVSRVRGMTEAFDLKHERELLYAPPEDSLAMSRAIQRLLKDRRLARVMAKAAGSFVRRHYTTKHLAQNVAECIERVL